MPSIENPPRPAKVAAAACCSETEGETMAKTTSCCGEASESGPGQAATIQKDFLEFLRAANTPGALDSRTKQAIALALSVLARCEPCLKAHIKKAKDMKFSMDEIDEAAWMAIAFGGSPTMMFYNGVRKEFA
jgi:AhpD family alkylhydroperoxidase